MRFDRLRRAQRLLNRGWFVVMLLNVDMTACFFFDLNPRLCVIASGCDAREGFVRSSFSIKLLRWLKIDAQVILG